MIELKKVSEQYTTEKEEQHA